MENFPVQCPSIYRKREGEMTWMPLKALLFGMIGKTVGLGLQGLFVYPAAKAGIVFIEQQVA